MGASTIELDPVAAWFRRYGEDLEFPLDAKIMRKCLVEAGDSAFDLNIATFAHEFREPLSVIAMRVYVLIVQGFLRSDGRGPYGWLIRVVTGTTADPADPPPAA